MLNEHNGVSSKLNEVIVSIKINHISKEYKSIYKRTKVLLSN